MRLSLEAFCSLLKGLNMLSIGVVRSGVDPGPSVGFALEDLPRIVPTRLYYMLYALILIFLCLFNLESLTKKLC